MRITVLTLASLLTLAGVSSGQIVTATFDTTFLVGVTPVTVTESTTSTVSTSATGGEYVTVSKTLSAAPPVGSTMNAGVTLTVPASMYTANALSVTTNGVNEAIMPQPGAGPPPGAGQLLYATGQVSLYSFGVTTQRVRGNFHFADNINVFSPVATVLKLPVRMGMYGLASESFGIEALTFGRFLAGLSGSLNGVPIGGGSLFIQSVSVIPEQGTLNVVADVTFAVNAGMNAFALSVTSHFDVESASVPAGLIAGASTVLFQLTGLEVGRFASADGSPLPAGLTVQSADFGFSYIAVPEPTSLTMAAMVGLPLAVRAWRRRR